MPEIKPQILVDVKKQVDAFFFNKNFTKKDYDNMTIAILSTTLVKVDEELQIWKDRATKHQIKP